MKTTVDIADDLLEEAKAVAIAERTTLRALVEEGLRRVLSGRKKPADRFVLRDAGVKGRGPARGIHEGDWEEIRDRIYRGRGA
jgi:hypothetical protein